MRILKRLLAFVLIFAHLNGVMAPLRANPYPPYIDTPHVWESYSLKVTRGPGKVPGEDEQMEFHLSLKTKADTLEHWFTDPKEATRLLSSLGRVKVGEDGTVYLSDNWGCTSIPSRVQSVQIETFGKIDVDSFFAPSLDLKGSQIVLNGTVQVEGLSLEGEVLFSSDSDTQTKTLSLRSKRLVNQGKFKARYLSGSLEDFVQEKDSTTEFEAWLLSPERADVDYEGRVFRRDVRVISPFVPLNLKVEGNLTFEKPLPVTELKKLEKLLCSGKLSFSSEVTRIDQDLSFGQTNVEISFAKPFELLAVIKAPSFTVNFRADVVIGSIADRQKPVFGMLESTEGDLVVNATGKLTAPAIKLSSKRDLRVLGEGAIDLGEFMMAPALKDKWIGYARDPWNRVLSQEIFELNGSFLSAVQGSVFIKGDTLKSQGLKTQSKRNTTFEAAQKIDMIRSIFHGQNGVFKSPILNIVTKGKSTTPLNFPHVGCGNRCGHIYTPRGYPLLSQPCEFDFLQDLEFESPKILLSIPKLTVGRSLFLDLKNVIFEFLTEDTRVNYMSSNDHRGMSGTHGCKSRGNLHSESPSLTAKAFSPEVKIGNVCYVKFDDATFQNLIASMRQLFLQGKKLLITNTSTHRITQKQQSMTVDLLTFLKDQIKQGNKFFDLKKDGSIVPSVPMSEVNNLEAFGPLLPVLTTASWKEIEGLPVLNPMKHVPLDFLLHHAFGHATGRLHHQGLYGKALQERILRNSEMIARLIKGGGDQQIILRTQLQDATSPFLYYTLQKYKDRIEPLLHLFVPGSAINPYQSSGDISADRIEVITEGDQTYSNGRVVGADGVTMRSTGGSITRQTTQDPATGRLLPQMQVISYAQIDTEADQDVTDIDTFLDAGGDITSKVGGMRHSLPAYDHISTTWGSKKSWHTVTTRNAHVSKMRAGGKIYEISTAGSIYQGTDLESEILSYLASRGPLAFPAAHSYRQEIHTSQRGGLFKAFSSTSSSQSTAHVAHVASRHGKVHLYSGISNVTGQGTHLSGATGIDIETPNGRPVLSAAWDAYQSHTSSVRSDFWMNTQAEFGTSSTTPHPWVVNPGTGRVTFTSAAPAVVEDTSTGILRQNLTPVLDVNQPLTWDTVDATLNTYYRETRSLGMGPRLAIALALSALTSGAGASMMSTLGFGEAVAATATTAATINFSAAELMTIAALDAGITTVATTAVTGFIDHGGSRILRDLDPRQLAVSMATAGITQRLGRAWDIDLNTHSLNILDHVKDQGLVTSVRMGLDLAVNPHDAGNLSHSVRNFAGNVMGSWGASHIGAWWHGTTIGMDGVPHANSLGTGSWLLHKGAHGLVGAGSGYIMEGERGMLPGAFGAISGEIGCELAQDYLISAALRDGRLLTAQDFESEILKPSAIIGKIGGVLASGALGLDVDIAHMTSSTAIEHNGIVVALPVIAFDYLIAALGFAAVGSTLYSAAQDNALETLGITQTTASGFYAFQGQIYRTLGAVLWAAGSTNPHQKALADALLNRMDLDPEANKIHIWSTPRPDPLPSLAGFPLHEERRSSILWTPASEQRFDLEGYRVYDGPNMNVLMNSKADTKDQILFPDNPGEKRTLFKSIRGTKAQESTIDNTIWERDTTGHGGSQWKVWKTKRSWENEEQPASVWPDGRVRKWGDQK